jgi:hypothetical protein
MGAPMRAGAVLTAVVFASGCVERYTIPTAQLQYLNGYDIHGEQAVNGQPVTERPYRLVSTQGQVVDYNSSKELVLLGKEGKPLTPSGPYELIFINGNTFDAVPLNGPAVSVPLDSVSAARVTQSTPDTTAVVFGSIGVAVAVLSVVLAIVAVANGQTVPPPCCDFRAQNPALK